MFEKSRPKSSTRHDSNDSVLNAAAAAAAAASANDADSAGHLAVQQMAFCAESRLLAVAAASGHVILFKFRRQEAASAETAVLHVPLFFEGSDELMHSPTFAQTAANLELSPRKEQPNPLKPRTGSYRRPPGFQADLLCLSPWLDGEAPALVTAICVNSAYGLYDFIT